MPLTMKILLVAVVLAMTAIVTEGCSCMLTHPQEHFCDADFVILVRVKREFVQNDTRVYKVRIRKQFKMSEKSEVALKSGRLLTPIWDSLCGIELEIGKLYVISGRVVTLRAHVNYCDMWERWETLSKRQRKGLSRMYHQGCNCRVKTCYSPSHCKKTKDSCVWNTWRSPYKVDCQKEQGICLRSASKRCMWARNHLQAVCMKNHSIASTPSSKPPLTISL